MVKPKILIPQAIPSVFEGALGEKNWLIFAIGKADERGKRPKRPVARDKPYIWVNRDRAASFTFAGAVQRLKDFHDWPGGLEAINARAAERRDKLLRETGKTSPAIEVEEYALGYFAREGSALIALDFDNVAECGMVVDEHLGDLLNRTEAYAEVSSSGTGVRVFMPRQWGDDSYHSGEKNDVGLFVSAKGAGCALTFNTIADGVERDQVLLDLVIERLGTVTGSEDRGDSGAVEDQVLDNGRVEVDQWLEMVAHVKNGEQFDTVEQWIGMIRGPKEYYELVDPDRLDEVYNALVAWSERWEGGEHDPDKFDEVWNRKTTGGAGKAGLGSWIHHAKAAGWDWPRPPRREPVAVLDAPEAGVLIDRESAYRRVVLIGNQFYDRLTRTFYDKGNSGLVNLVAPAFERLTKEGSVPESADKVIAFMRQNCERYTSAALMPGEPGQVEDMMPTARGSFVDCPGARVFNLWEPLRVGDTEEVPTLWIEHVRRLYGDDADTLMDWLAFVVQNPGAKVGWSPILIGPQGCGKDTIVSPVVNAFTDVRQAQGNLSVDAIEQTHNGWIETTLLVVMQESVTGRMTKANVTEKLKTYIAAPPDTLPLRKMGQDTVQIPNRLNLLFLTNHIDTVYMENNERRFWPIQTHERPDEDYFERLWQWLKGGGEAAVLAWLARRRITLVKERSRAPESAVKEAVVRANLPEGAEELLGWIEGKRWVSTKHIKAWLTGPAEFGGPGVKMSDRSINAVLDHAGYRRLGRVTVRRDLGKENHPVYVVRNLASPSLPSREEIIGALEGDSDLVEKSQRRLTLVGEAGVEGEADKIL